MVSWHVMTERALHTASSPLCPASAPSALCPALPRVLRLFLKVEFMFISFDGDMIPRFEEPYLRCRPVFTDGILIRILYVHSRAGPGDGSGARWP